MGEEMIESKNAFIQSMSCRPVSSRHVTMGFSAPNTANSPPFNLAPMSTYLIKQNTNIIRKMKGNTYLNTTLWNVNETMTVWFPPISNFNLLRETTL